MFNGIIKNTGSISNIYKKKSNCFIEIISKMNFNKQEIGASISCSGTCLTIDKIKNKKVKFYLSVETLDKTNFKYSKKGDIINLERSLIYGERVSGHFVQGHVDTTAKVKKIKHVGKAWAVDFKLHKKFFKYIVLKGSITINGVSLTIAKISKEGFQISIIPKTLSLTNLIYLKEKDFVNIEFDILGKYIKNFIK
jgi:riboflavin synthase